MNNIRQKVLDKIVDKYSSTAQTFHIRQLNQLIDEEPTPLYFLFEDLVDLSEDEEFLKRYYQKHESKNKQMLFGQYYSLLVNKPRVIDKDLQHLYEKWHYKKRKLLFKDIEGESKLVLNTSDSNAYTNDPTQVTRFLYNISTYNPQSQKYYLQKQSKEKQKNKFQDTNMDRQGRSIESMLNQVLNNSYGKKITQISFVKKKQNNRYHSIDNVLSQRKSEVIIRTKKSSKLLLTQRKSQNLYSSKVLGNIKGLNLRGVKTRPQNPEKEKPADRIVKTLSHTHFHSIQSPQKLPKKTILMPSKSKVIGTQFSDKKFQTPKMPKLNLNLNMYKDQKIQKANKILSLKLKC